MGSFKAVWQEQWEIIYEKALDDGMIDHEAVDFANETAHAAVSDMMADLADYMRDKAREDVY
jgi:hypothetical protein